VEIPIEQVPVVQKQLIFKANLAGKPVITATQMLESMTENIRPTRAEVTDVANAILDGTDALMLSEETAIGKYPVDAVGMMARIARVTERERSSLESGALVSESIRRSIARKGAVTEDVISLDVVEALRTLNVRYVLAPTVSGGTPRRISRYKGNAWILSFSPDEAIRNFLALSYGVYPFVQQAIDADEDILVFLRNKGLIRQGDKVLITRRLPNEKSGKINSLRIVTLR
jgi:pyruvate kinase